MALFKRRAKIDRQIQQARRDDLREENKSLQERRSIIDKYLFIIIGLIGLITLVYLGYLKAEWAAIGFIVLILGYFLVIKKFPKFYGTITYYYEDLPIVKNKIEEELLKSWGYRVNIIKTTHEPKHGINASQPYLQYFWGKMYSQESNSYSRPIFISYSILLHKIVNVEPDKWPKENQLFDWSGAQRYPDLKMPQSRGFFETQPQIIMPTTERPKEMQDIEDYEDGYE